MNKIDINDVDLYNAYFHFTNKDNLENIDKDGLKAQIGDASKMVDDKARVCMSKGGKGILGAKNSFIHEFKKLRICDIPEGYRKYFSLTNYARTEQVKDEDVYAAMEKRFKDEVYLKVDATKGQDFLEEDIHGLGAAYDIKGKENHDIEPEKLSLLTSEDGNSAFDITQYLYDRLLDNAQKDGKGTLVKEMLSDLSGMFEHIQQRDNVDEFKRQIIEEGLAIAMTGEEIMEASIEIQSLDREPLYKDEVTRDD